MLLTRLTFLVAGVGLLACGGETDHTEPDLTPPTVSMTGPGSGTKVTGMVALSATAEDSSGIAGVTFRVDGVPIGAEDLVAPYGLAWNSASVAAGTHQLTALARDSAGNSLASSAVSVSVDNLNPTVSVSAPTSLAKVAGTVAVAATASDASGIAGVTFKVDGVQVGAEDLLAPFTADWNTTLATEGSHSVTAVARDSVGRTATTTPVSVSVDNVPLGTLRVTLTSAGGAPLSGSARITIDGGALGANRAVGTFPVDSLVAPGAYSVTLSGLDPQCTLTGAATQAVSVTADSTTTVAYTASCGYANVVAVAFMDQNTSRSSITLFAPTGAMLGSVPIDSTRFIYSLAMRPGGKALAYVIGMPGGLARPIIRIRDLVSGVDSVLTSFGAAGDDKAISWSPDGMKFAFSDSAYDLRILDMSTGVATVILDSLTVHSLDWSPDGNTIAFAAYRVGNLQINTISVTGTALTAIAPPPDGTGDDEPAYSPDGTMIYFRSTRTPQVGIWRMGAGGTSPGPFTSGTGIGLDYHPSPSPSGSQLAFVRNQGVWILDLGASEYSFKSQANSVVTGLDWAP